MLQSRNNLTENTLTEPCNQNCSFCFINYSDVLSLNPLFKGLNNNEIGLLIRDVHHQVKALHKNDILAVEGDSLDHLIIILEGSVVGDMMDFEGNILRIEKIEAGNTIASAFIFGESAKLPVTITAVENTRLLFIQKDDLLALFTKNKIFLRNYLDIISDRARFLRKKIRLLGLNSIKGKIAFYLLEIVKKSGSLKIILPHTQNELSEMFGVARPSVGRAFRELHKEGSIMAQGKNIVILDKNKLSGFLKAG
ncbi:MAG: Crp/Fnr family transcriptional regulator [Bacteroidales bacterium]|nr:Crp/Fnr family transcriptional regulator [Bacteroidales bacterium]MCF8389840.1 Crp/Fnr family transcriptional regulator [Bacteroidales bacterium]